MENKNLSTEGFGAFLQAEMDDQNIPAMSVLIFKEDNILYENYLGQAQIEQQIDLANNQPFLLASVSKVVTATALMQLQETGNFDLDDPINDYLDFEVNPSGYATNITFRMLLTHTSGINDGNSVSDDNYFNGEDSPIALDFFIKNFLVLNGEFYDASENFYDFNPGSEQEYSNIGNALIGVLVEQISGMDFVDYCQQNIFNPLGMTNTNWRLEDISGTIVQPYDYLNGQFEEIEHYTLTDYPNGGLRSTARDMFTFLSAFAQNGMANNHQLLSPGTVEVMITPQIPNISYDMGLHLFQVDQANNLWGHDGGRSGRINRYGLQSDE
ncbi:MAG: CubicO group peptidase (beta-lactamase class C family) [Saprospiraceae bacterium]|jgi:CubicO group peptidase (beta-lactamase class C family)